MKKYKFIAEIEVNDDCQLTSYDIERLLEKYLDSAIDEYVFAYKGLENIELKEFTELNLSNDSINVKSLEDIKRIFKYYRSIKIGSFYYYSIHDILATYDLSLDFIKRGDFKEDKELKRIVMIIRNENN